MRSTLRVFLPLISARYGVPASTLRLALLLVLALFATNCKRPHSRTLRAGEEDHRDLAGKLAHVIEAAGRSQVWIKSPKAASFPKPETPVEAKVGTEVYPAVISAFRREAKMKRLDCEVNESRTQEGWRVANIRLSRNGRPVCRWKIREVHRILHAAIIIDDLGQNLPAAHKLLSMPYPLTFSVLPHLQYSAETAQEARRAGREVILHLPMEPEPGSHASPGEGAIRVGMGNLEVEHILQSDLASVPNVVGVNNHMGSRATADPRLMAEVMRSLAKRHLYFVDSRTTAASVALEAARQEGLPSFYRSVFLDDTQTVPYTLAQLHKFRRLLEEQGAALAIGHPYPTTIAALARFLPELESDDVQLAPASRLLQLPEVARLTPTVHHAAMQSTSVTYPSRDDK